MGGWKQINCRAHIIFSFFRSYFVSLAIFPILWFRFISLRWKFSMLFGKQKKKKINWLYENDNNQINQNYVFRFDWIISIFQTFLFLLLKIKKKTTKVLYILVELDKKTHFETSTQNALLSQQKKKCFFALAWWIQNFV